MKLPSQKRILREDLKGAPSWVGPLIDTLNSFMETVYRALNKNVTFSDNIAANVKEFTYKTTSTYPAAQDNVEFVSGLKTKASGVLLFQVYETSSYSPPPGPVYIPWVEINGTIIISTITGLEPSKTYLVRVAVV